MTTGPLATAMPVLPEATAGFRWQWRLVVALLLTSWALLTIFPNGQLALRIDSSAEALGQARVEDQRDQLMIAGFAPQQLSPADVRDIASLENQLRQVSGVSRSRSIASVDIPLTDGEDIQIAPLAARLDAADSAEAQQLVAAALREPLTRGRLTSADGRAATIIVELAGESAADRLATALEVRRLVDDYPSPRLDWLATGAPLVTQEIGGLLLRQMSVVLPTALVIFSLVVLLAFRSVLAVGATLLSIGCALLWTLAVCVQLGWAINLVTIVIPPLVLTLGVSYAMHVVSIHADTRNLPVGLNHIRWALVFSALTTAIGLGALAFNSLESVRQFAVLGAVGALAAALAAWTVLPLGLSLSRQPPALWPPVHSLLMRGANRIVRLVVAHSRRVIQVGLVLLLICLAGASLVKPGARYVGDLPADQPARVAFERISAAFGGASRFHVEVQGAATDVMLAPTVLQAMDELQDWLEAQPEVGGTLSLTDFIKRLNQSFGSGGPDDYRIPSDQGVVKQLLFVGAPNEIYEYTDLSYTRMRIAVRTGETNTPELRALFDRLEERLKLLPTGLSVSLGGEAVEFTQVTEDLAGGQLRSLGTAALAIYLLLSLLFASARVGLMAMLPNMLPVVAYFALLGFSGTALSPTTALVACIVLGIAVDDTLHLLVRFNQLAREMANEDEATRAAVAEVLRPISLTTLATSLGFLTLLTSPFHSQAVFGLLAAVTLLMAWVSDLLLAPAVSARSSIVTLWDHLRLDLGGNPQRTIPMMAGMSERQARQFALNASIRQVAAGDNLIAQGEQSAEMYVVLDGNFRIWTGDGSGEARVLAERGRGTTLGEVGYFAATRSASATALEDARVLVLDPDILERLRLRHPRIAALVYRNLNLIQAERALRNA